jgi:UDP-3-O-[3-hydroxymyristoyl] glucosamine N-acyltransferase
MEFSAKQIAQLIQGEVIGNENAMVHTFCKIEESVPNSLSFLSNPKYTHYLYTTQASVVLINKEFVLEEPVHTTLIKVANAYEALAQLLSIYNDIANPPKKGVSPLAYVSPTAKLAADVYVEPFAFIGDEATIGEGAQIYSHAVVGAKAKIGAHSTLNANVTIYHHCEIGEHCILHSGSVIGADGFGFAPTTDGYKKIPQIGKVVLEDNVEIGANTCVDRATMGQTVVHKGVKLDNLVQIAHNDKIGANTVMAAQAGVAGSVEIGEWCMIGGQVGIAGHIKVGDHVNVGGQSGVPSNIKPNQTLLGTPAIDAKIFFRSSAVYKNLPEMYRTVYDMKKEIEELKKQIKKQE